MAKKKLVGLIVANLKPVPNQSDMEILYIQNIFSFFELLFLITVVADITLHDSRIGV
jgi:hypothetical protein